VARLGASAWGAVLLTALLGLALSLVAVSTASDAPAPGPQVLGSASVAHEVRPPEPRRTKPKPGRTVSRSPATLDDARDATAGTSRPLRVSIPAIDLAGDVGATGVDPDGQMRLPRDPGRFGWYRYGPAPGQGTGSVVLAGHVDSATYGVGPLARLVELRPGDTVSVLTEAGRWRRYRVDSLERFDRQALPSAVFSRSGPERLRLVTCTGAYLAEQGGYQENLVVTAVPDRSP
jgi:hypothetical protein